jgi:P2 family phage contractile tail tube protein
MGRLDEFEIPQPKREMMEYKSLAMAGRVKIPMGWAALEATYKWTSFDPDVFLNICATSSPSSVSFTGDAQTISSAGLIQEVPVTGALTGPFDDPGTIILKAQTNFETTTKQTVWHVELDIGGVQIYLYDAFSNQFVVGGVDQLAVFRANAGVG